jgi:hypothetical protein
MMYYSYKKTIRTTSTRPEGEVEELVIEQCTGPEAKAKMEEADKITEGAEKKMEQTFAKMDRFFNKMSEAFKELW